MAGGAKPKPATSKTCKKVLSSATALKRHTSKKFAYSKTAVRKRQEPRRLKKTQRERSLLSQAGA
jgi:hypothetical protein